MTLQDYKIQIPSELYYGEEISGLDIIVYSYLQVLSFRHLFPKYSFHSNSLAYYICKTEKLPKENISKISESVERIFAMDFISGEKIAKNTYVVDSESMRKMPHYYTFFDFTNLEKILESQYSYKYNLVKHYVLVLGGRHYEKYVNYMPVSWYAEKLNCSESTVMRYTTALENLGLIYVFRDDCINTTNLCGDIVDKDKIIAYANKKHRKERSGGANNKRSLSMKYNHIERTGECPYSPDVVQQIYDYVILHNKVEKDYKDRFPESNVKFYDPAILEPYLT